MRLRLLGVLGVLVVEIAGGGVALARPPKSALDHARPDEGYYQLGVLPLKLEQAWKRRTGESRSDQLARIAAGQPGDASKDSALVRAARARRLEAGGPPLQAQAARLWMELARARGGLLGLILGRRAVRVLLRGGDWKRAEGFLWRLEKQTVPGATAAKILATLWTELAETALRFAAKGDGKDLKALKRGWDRASAKRVEGQTTAVGAKAGATWRLHGESAQALAVSAALYEALQEDDLALQSRRVLLWQYPASEASLAWTKAHPEAAMLGLKALGSLEGTLRVEALLAAHLNERVTEESLRLLGREGLRAPLRCRLRLALARALRKLRTYEDLLLALQGIRGDCLDGGSRRSAEFLRASALSLARGLPAAPAYRALFLQDPSDPRSEQALFFEADVFLKAKRPQGARRVWAEIVRRWPQGRYGLESAWRLARHWLLENKPLRARAALLRYRRLASRRHQGLDRARSDFFLASLELNLPGRRRQAKWRLLGIVQAQPFSLFAGFARRLMAREFPSWPLPTDGQLLGLLSEARRTAPPPPRPKLGQRFLKDPRVQAAHALLGLGLREGVGDLLRARLKRSNTAEEQLAIARLLVAVGETREAQLLLRKGRGRRLRGRPSWETLWVYYAAYPLAFRKELQRAAKESGVEPALLEAIMREESALDPSAVSWAGAVGLLQIMPLTAADAGRRLGLSVNIDEASLKDPELNLRLAAELLSRFGKELGSELPIQIAAYNAGSRSVEAWLQDTPNQDLPLFIETMGYAETRRYTRRVVRSFSIYRLFYGNMDTRMLSLTLRFGQNAAAAGPRP